jgi:16S rRNA (uracil1498-N3)-methyltransferase
MHRVYISAINQREFLLSPEESRYLLKSLRLHVNDRIEVTDGKGTLAQAVILGTENFLVKIKILSTDSITPPHPYLHLAVAPTKNPDRFEWFIEKAVEIGVNEITPLVCEHSEKIKVNHERLSRIMIAALKQSQNVYLPKLNTITQYSNFIEQTDDVHQKLIAHCHGLKKVSLVAGLNNKQNTIILIGPEGDFSKNEIALAASHNYMSITLGNQRLRTETAALFSCAVFRALFS